MHSTSMMRYIQGGTGGGLATPHILSYLDIYKVSYTYLVHIQLGLPTFLEMLTLL